ncbi:hypothetical protein PVT71_18280 [Salipiger sp. H15]|uniref:Addiction module protein n=1 Tax=Alloyangia sp. H15 TaxID=3029062 RepID=A0AAU8AQ14_9RHOB
MGRLPAEVRGLTPQETSLLIEAWNQAQQDASGEVAPPSVDEYEELVKRYG